MGTDIGGSIEINDNGQRWLQVVDIGVIADREYGLWGELFGVKGMQIENAIAFNRGLPSDASEATLRKYNESEMHVYTTWILRHELQGKVWNMVLDRWTEMHWSWRLIFSLMSKLGRHFGQDMVRLVVWFGY